jgi:hypothetical protein
MIYGTNYFLYVSCLATIWYEQKSNLEVFFLTYLELFSEEDDGFG